MRAELDRIFLDAMRQHQAGRLAEAEAGYRQVLGRDPDFPAARLDLRYLLRARNLYPMATTEKSQSCPKLHLFIKKLRSFITPKKSARVKSTIGFSAG